MTFQRSQKTIEKQILFDGPINDVIRDATVNCSLDGHVYFLKDGNYYRVQFPKALRHGGISYITDLKVCEQEGKQTFYSSYKGTIRDMSGNVVG